MKMVIRNITLYYNSVFVRLPAEIDIDIILLNSNVNIQAITIFTRYDVQNRILFFVYL